MELVNIKKLEDCFDSSSIYEYFFDEEVSEKLMKGLAGDGRLKYFPDFERPFFKIISTDSIQIKGIIGDKSFEVAYPSEKKVEKKHSFEDNLIALL
ncbi:MAG: hypothetical protein KAR14_11795 [Candidatus Aminicenantes bacterium]|nr:hypothetical protein [Candidatus Aminicenantes bacterium]